VEIFLSMWGTEVYTVDGVEVLRLKSMALRATRRFEVGDPEKHLVEVKVDAFPSWKVFIAPSWIAEVYVDGELVVDELYPEMRRRFARIHRVLNYVLIASLSILAILTLILVSLVLWFFVVNPSAAP